MPNVTKKQVADEPKWLCAWCDKMFPESEEHRFDISGNNVCESCQENDGIICEGCEELLLSSDAYTWRDMQLCPSCYDYEMENEEARYNRDVDIYRQVKNRSTKFLDNDVGDIIKSTRAFGIEIEFLSGTDEDNLYRFASKLPEQYGIENDGSLQGDGIDIEIQTPKLSGKIGETQIIETCRLINEVAEGFVNHSCGLHLHIDTRDITRQDKYAPVVRKIFQFYYMFEDVIMAMLPKSRRDNGYCKRLLPAFKEYDFSNAFNNTCIDDLEKLWYNTKNKKEIARRKRDKDGTRYYGLNLHSMLANEHLEIRYHGGTLNAVKMCNWIQLHLYIVDMIIDSFENNGCIRFGQGMNGLDNYAREMRKTIHIKDKLDIFYTALDLPNNLRDYFDARINKFNDDIIVRIDEPIKTEKTEDDMEEVIDLTRVWAGLNTDDDDDAEEVEEDTSNDNETN